MTGRVAPGSLETLPQVLAWRAATTPQETAERCKIKGIWRPYDWAAVEGEVRRIALGMQSLAVQPGDRVAIIGENRPELFWAEFGAHAIGATTVNLYPDATAEELLYVLRDSNAVLLFAEDQEQVDKALAVRDRAPGLRRIVYWNVRGLWSYRRPELLSLADLQRLADDDTAAKSVYAGRVAAGRGADIALISYTSGTTGQPKGVIWSHAALLSNARRLLAALPFPQGCQYLSYISPSWGTEQVFGVAAGLIAPMVVNFPERPEEVLRNIRELAVEALAFSPRQWESLAASVRARMLAAGPFRRWLVDSGLAIGHAVDVNRLDGKPVPRVALLLHPLAEWLVLRPLRDKLGLTRVKIALSGGSAMAPDLFRFFHAIGVRLRNIYGISEFGLCAVHQGERFDLETVGHWLPQDPAWPPVEWRVDARGELLLKGGVAFNGYYNQLERSLERWQDGWFRTGDAVTIAPGGELVFLDRLDDLRHLANEHAYPPQYLETRLRLSPFVKDVLILGDRRHEFVSALVNIAFDVVAQWAENRRLPFSTFADLSQSKAVTELISAEIERANRLLPSGSRISRFANFPKELDPDEGELTRTRKLRRDVVERRYAGLVGAIYGGAAVAECVLPITYTDGRRGTFNASVRIVDIETDRRPATQPRRAVV